MKHVVLTLKALVIVAVLACFTSCKDEVKESVKNVSDVCPVQLLTHDAISQVDYADGTVTFHINEYNDLEASKSYAYGFTTSQDMVNEAIGGDEKAQKDFYLTLLFMSKSEELDSLMQHDFNIDIAYSGFENDLGKAPTSSTCSISKDELVKFRDKVKANKNFLNDNLLSYVSKVFDQREQIIGGDLFQYQKTIVKDHNLVLCVLANENECDLVNNPTETGMKLVGMLTLVENWLWILQEQGIMTQYKLTGNKTGTIIEYPFTYDHSDVDYSILDHI